MGVAVTTTIGFGVAVTTTNVTARVGVAEGRDTGLEVAVVAAVTIPVGCEKVGVAD